MKQYRNNEFNQKNLEDINANNIKNPNTADFQNSKREVKIVYNSSYISRDMILQILLDTPINEIKQFPKIVEDNLFYILLTINTFMFIDYPLPMLIINTVLYTIKTIR